MPPKRKVGGSHLASPSPEEPRRRSSRRVKEQYEGKENNNDISPKAYGGLFSKEEVQKARNKLSEMELKLFKEVKRQRLAVAASDLQTKAELEDDFDLSKFSNGFQRKAASNAQEMTVQQSQNGDNVTTDASPSNDVDGERGSRRPAPVNSDRLPLPWNGRLGYACLNTYLRAANPPIFSSRTCRISSILEHRHPLQDPTQPEHPTKNRPDKTQLADERRGVKYVQDIGLNNARDIVKMLRWNDKYGIKFMRLSSEMFPFASHKEYGYSLAFAAPVLAEAGRVASELGHRLTTHPGQFTQIGSPRKEVVAASVRDLEYHDELLSLLSLPGQLDRDAVMILHMGGTFGDKQATLDRFRQNYVKLSAGVQKRLVLENDDVSWSVHDLLPICEELNIPLVLDFHHHNIIFDSSVREGTQDVISLFDRIRATWTRKNITQKMHYSEPTAAAITPRERRKHSPRVKVLPPCPADMDLMIEAKDKEQAVFELMRTYKLPGWNLFNDIIPYERDDEPRKAVLKKVKKAGKLKQSLPNGNQEVEIETAERIVSPDEISMGGTERRVYWPEGMEEWLKPRKRESKKNGIADGTKNGCDDDDDEI